MGQLKQLPSALLLMVMKIHVPWAVLSHPIMKERKHSLVRLSGCIIKPRSVQEGFNRALLFIHSLKYSILLFQDTISIYNHSIENCSLFITKKARCHFQSFQFRSHPTRANQFAKKTTITHLLIQVVQSSGSWS